MRRSPAGGMVRVQAVIAAASMSAARLRRHAYRPRRTYVERPHVTRHRRSKIPRRLPRPPYTVLCGTPHSPHQLRVGRQTTTSELLASGRAAWRLRRKSPVSAGLFCRLDVARDPCLDADVSLELERVRLRRDALAGLAWPRRQGIVRHRDEVQSVAAVVADLDQCALGVRLDDGADRPRRPAPGINPELNDVEDRVLGMRHGQSILAGFQGMSTHVDVSRGGFAPWIIHVVTTGAVAPLRPSIVTRTS